MPKSKVFNYEVSEKLKSVIASKLNDFIRNDRITKASVDLIAVMIELEVIVAYNSYLSEMVADMERKNHESK